MNKLMQITLIFLCCDLFESSLENQEHREAIFLVQKWASTISRELHYLSTSITRRDVLSEVYSKAKVVEEDGNRVVKEIARDLRKMMQKKEDGVKRIADTAEYLAAIKRDTITTDSSYDYYNADNITATKMAEADLKTAQEDLKEMDFQWRCELGDPSVALEITADRKCINSTYFERPIDYRQMHLIYDERFQTEVNLNHSVIKVVTNIYDREEEVLNGARWSEPLDVIFKKNLKEDSSLTWQYFASPVGFMRHFPAVQWSQESYEVTYDFRMRSWYTEAMASPKDIIILLDRSGSMTGIKRKIAAYTVNNILDTLNDNDFVNIYTFASTTEPLVDCFNDTLVQANEENLRLLRESLPTFIIKNASNIAYPLETAFELLKRFRGQPDPPAGSQCNQAIMLITEGIDYDYNKTTLFKKLNWEEKYYRPVRIFTYLIGNEKTDAAEMEWIACSNMGYYVNITLMEEVREKVLKYVNVMSRPINMNQENIVGDAPSKIYEPIWSYLYVDLADRRLPNWLWKKLEGNRQREVFLDFAKREMMNKKLVFVEGITKHMLLEEDHPYAKYEKLIAQPFNYMTTVSMPVFDRRENRTELLGVAGIDVPISLIRSFIPYHRLGVNAYAFILTNNGYILMHPDLRSEFQNILKPTYNRVDMTEVELLDDSAEPRLFNQSIVELRDRIVRQMSGRNTLSIVDHMDNMKRILKYTRHYFYEMIPPFSLVVALPKNYGFNIINFTNSNLRDYNEWKDTGNWSVHPEWPYCKYKSAGNSATKSVIDCIIRNFPEKCKCNLNLMRNLVTDGKLTKWFHREVERPELKKKYMIQSIFLATHSGLTRWKSDENFTNIRSIDESWYKRAVEENIANKDTFIYSVPFEIIGYENNTLVRVSSAVFSETNGKKAPAAVTGFQFNQRALYDLFTNVTMAKNDKYRCGSANITCFILDNNGYVVLSDEEEYAGNLYTGNFIGDIRPDIMKYLVEDGVYTPTRMFDYQGICYYNPKEEKSSAYRNFNFFVHFMKLLQWIVITLWYFLEFVAAGGRYQSVKESTLAWERLAINKTVPTPCDKETWLFTFGPNTSTTTPYNNRPYTPRGEHHWPYVVKHIDHSNLLLLAINANLPENTEYQYNNGPNPKEIPYNVSLPCYIAIKNTYTRKSYMSCFKKDEKEYRLNENRTYCGGEDMIEMYQNAILNFLDF